MSEIIDFIVHIDRYLNILVQNYGSLVYVVMFVVVFVETGLVVMPLLPGDSMLFVAGTFAAVGSMNVISLFLILSVAAVLGDTVNYWIGNYFGEKFFSKFIKKEHMERTKSFYDRHGKKTIVIARFVPIIRTFAPFIAGIGKMNYSTFLTYNVIGGVSWVLIFVFAGYSFGTIPFVKENLTLITLSIIFVSLIPAFVEYVRGRKK
ncbi:MAG: DedA family protein [Candidatus Gracilibacteria bacterium]|jgi:membrane-associated protein